MTRKALEAFNPEKLKNGSGKGFEVRNKKTGYSEFHYFYRSLDGKLFAVVTKNMNKAVNLRNEWLAARRKHEQSFHLHLDIQSLLELTADEFEREYACMFTDDIAGHILSQAQVRLILQEEIEHGHKKFPVGKCDNFDFEKGCRGHEEIYKRDDDEIRRCLIELHARCSEIDEMGELHELVDGSLLDRCARALGYISSDQGKT